MKYWLYPNLKKSDLVHILRFSCVGSAIGGLYGVIHDQFTYSISSEYFTVFKFRQFSYLDFGLPDRVLVGEIGFLATAWVGFAVGWFLSRWFLPRLPYQYARRTIYIGLACVFMCGMFAGIGAWVCGLFMQPSSNLNGWSYELRYYGVTEGWDFVRVAYIHYGSYAGGFAGLVFSILGLRRVQSVT